MTDHLSPTTLSAFADGELPDEQAAAAKLHLDACLNCSSKLIDDWLLKASISKAGHRYAMPGAAEQRILDLMAKHPPSTRVAKPSGAVQPPRKRINWPGLSGWVAAAALLILFGWNLLNLRGRPAGGNSIESAALLSEACDLHIAALAANTAPQVISSDRHTVKPWFQGKLPFSFNLPETLPAGVRLDGANLVYLHDQPVAQLLFSIGLHHASVFIEQRSNSGQTADSVHARSGFQVVAFTTSDLELIAVSDVDRQSLMQLAAVLHSVQSQP